MIKQTITDDYHFWNWLMDSSGYKSNFSQQGAKAIQAYMEQYSEDTGEDVEFDPIAWCCEFNEYDNLADIHEQYGDPEATLDHYRDYTTVIELDNGHIILGEF